MIIPPLPEVGWLVPGPRWEVTGIRVPQETYATPWQVPRLPTAAAQASAGTMSHARHSFQPTLPTVGVLGFFVLRGLLVTLAVRQPFVIMNGPSSSRVAINVLRRVLNSDRSGGPSAHSRP